MEPPALAELLAEAARCVAEQGRAVLAQIVRAEGSTPGKPGWKLLVRPDGGWSGNLGGGAFEALVIRDAEAKLAEPRPVAEVKRYYLTERAVKGEPTGMVCGGMVEVFLEVLAAKPVAVVCGGGPVGQALARNAVFCGFDCLVAEDRPAYRRLELFPAGTALAEVSRDYGEGFLSGWEHRELFVAVVTRCWETDTAALAAVLRQRLPGLRYLGVMGSRRKVDRVREEVAARGLDPGAVEIHAPIGVPIGGEEPGEIAVSILAEMIQVRRRRGGGDLPAAGATPRQREEYVEQE
jgi:xanthine dehydrogenase accessory factor